MKTYHWSENVPQLVIMLSGAVLMVVGVVLVVVQLAHELSLPTFSGGATRSVETSPTGGIKLSTTYVGLVVLAIGAALEIVGYVAATPWRGRDRSPPNGI
jgi:uncharacterized membrane protein